jgi:hypothetical protein
MRKKTKIQKRPPKSADSLLKTRNKKHIELTEQELGKISGGSHKIKLFSDAVAGDLSATVKFKF